MKKNIFCIILVVIGIWIIPNQTIFAQKDNLIDHNNFNLRAEVDQKGNVVLNWHQFEADEIIIARNKKRLVVFEGKIPTTFVDEAPLAYEKNSYRIIAIRKKKENRLESIHSSLSKEVSVQPQITSTEKYLCYDKQTALLSIPEAKGATYKWFKDGKPYPHALDLSVLSIQGAGIYHAEVKIDDKIFQIDPITIPEGDRIDLKVRTIRNISGKIVRLETDQQAGIKYFWSPVITKNNNKTLNRDHFGVGVSYDVPMDLTEVSVSAQLDGGCSTHQIIKIENSLVEENFASIYPNPFTERFILRLKNATKGSIKLSVSDLQGKTIWQFETLSENALFEKEVDLNGQAKGVYLLRVQTDEGAWTQKLIKE